MVDPGSYTGLADVVWQMWSLEGPSSFCKGACFVIFIFIFIFIFVYRLANVVSGKSLFFLLRCPCLVFLVFIFIFF